jgi:hypothetical protein
MVIYSKDIINKYLIPKYRNLWLEIRGKFDILNIAYYLINLINDKNG